MSTPINETGELPAHILVIDDDTRLRKLIRKYLQEHGFLVTAAASSEIARQYMASFQFDYFSK